MKKYRILDRNYKGNILLESDRGEIIMMNEGKFRDTFTKIGNAVKKGYEKVKTFIENVVTGFDIIKNNADGVAVIFNGDKEEIYDEYGVKSQDSKFRELINETNEYEANSGQFLMSFIYDIYDEFDAFLEKYKNMKKHSILERAYPTKNIESRFDDDVYPIDLATDLIDNDIRYKSFDKGDGTKVTIESRRFKSAKDANLSKVRLQARLEFQNLNIDNYTLKDALDTIMTSVYSVFNMEITEKSALEDSDNDFIHKTFLLWGPSGIGKTSIVQSIANKFKSSKPIYINFGKQKYELDQKEVQVVYVNCGNLTQYSISVPVQGSVVKYKRDRSGRDVSVIRTNGTIGNLEKDTNKVVRFVPSKLFPSFNYETAKHNGTIIDDDIDTGYGIIILDELTRASAQVYGALMNVLQTRKVTDDYVLGTHWCVIATSNRPQDIVGVGGNLSPAMKIEKENCESFISQFAVGNRFLHMNYTPTRDEWYGWAVSNHKLHKLVEDFLNIPLHKHRWYNTRIDTESVAGTPKLWIQLSEAISNYIKLAKIEDLSGMDTEDIKYFCDYVANICHAMLGADADAFVEYIDQEYKGLRTDECKLFWTKDNVGITNDTIIDRNDGIGFGYNYAGVDTFVKKLDQGCPVNGKDLMNETDVKAFLGDINRYKYFKNVFMNIGSFFADSKNMRIHVVKSLVSYYARKIRSLIKKDISNTSIVNGITGGDIKLFKDLSINANFGKDDAYCSNAFDCIFGAGDGGKTTANNACKEIAGSLNVIVEK